MPLSLTVREIRNSMKFYSKVLATTVAMIYNEDDGLSMPSKKFQLKERKK